MDIKELKGFFKDDIFAMDMGIKIVSADENSAVCRLKTEARHMNAGNTVQGGVIFTLADFTFAVSANAADILTVTAESKIKFIAPAFCGELSAKAEKTGEDKNLCFYDVFVTGEKGKLIAKANFTGYRKG